ncbi:MAG: ADP-ribosylglycohydrolase family protein [Defluviitaleaceae bacterium]|nr:ADP-ribosylglycohydrolase family protein [Defluviitaleaceae bacterium]
MVFNTDDYKNKVLGCWMGKNIGGTLGMPMEWVRQVNDVSFFPESVITAGAPLANDDLDLQLIWLIAMEERGIDIDAAVLGEYWLAYISPHWAEYGKSKANMRAGLMPPLSGMVDNAWKNSNGAWIRSEIWACVAPGCPKIAAKYAYEDAIVDHGDGEGMYGAVFCAAVESAAFVEGDTHKLIEIGLSFIPENCGVARAIACAIKCHKSGKTWLEARHELLVGHRGHAPGWGPNTISDADRANGFFEGEWGYDAPLNIAIIILGWLYGDGDFEKSLLITVNCGEDTDCTAGTFGAIYGIIHGIDGIPEKWKTPIGRVIKTVSLNLGDLGYLGDQLPQDIDALTERTLKISRQVLARHAAYVKITGEATDTKNARDLKSPNRGADIYRNLRGPVYKSPMADVLVEYPEGAFVRDGQQVKINLRIISKHKIPQRHSLRVYAPDEWAVGPAKKGKVPADGFVELQFTAPEVPENVNRFAVELTADGTATVMLVPLALFNGNLC